MLPQALLNLSYHLEGEQIVPHYLARRDERWLGALLEEQARFIGRKRVEWLQRLREPLSIPAPKLKLGIASRVLEGWCGEHARVAAPPKELRAALFRRAASGREPREAVLNAVAAAFQISVAELHRALFADLRAERCVGALPEGFSAARLASSANLAIAISFVRRALEVRVVVWGDSQFRALVRQARVMGLLCRISLLRRHLASVPSAPSDAPAASTVGVALEISGPFALFRHTEVYARALASLVPVLVRCADYELNAVCLPGPGHPRASFVLRPGVVEADGTVLARRERRVERRFLRDFQRVARGWEVVHDPAPLELGDSLVFADFELIPRGDGERPHWWLEIVGFWTRKYLLHKLDRLRRAGNERVILCIDERGDCGAEELPSDVRLLHYKTRIDVQAVLALINQTR